MERGLCPIFFSIIEVARCFFIFEKVELPCGCVQKPEVSEDDLPF